MPASSADALPDLLTPATAAERLAVCRATIYRLIAAGELAAVRVGSLLRIAPAALAAFLARSPTSARPARDVPGVTASLARART